VAKIGNEAKLILKLALEKMNAKKLSWAQRSSNPNSNSSNKDWLNGYEQAWTEWNETLYSVSHDLES